jgi:hypothetical protein
MLKTSEEWQKECLVEIMDPDGWDRSSPGNFIWSWSIEKITKQEFEKRLSSSTCQFNVDDLNNIWNK